MEITINPNRTRETFAVYKLAVIYDGGLSNVHLGILPMCDLLQLSDARKIKRIAKILKMTDTAKITVLATFPDMDAARSALPVFSAVEGVPIEQAPDEPANRRTQPVRCSNGEEYETISEAARALGIPYQSISNHLNGRYGYKTVRGGLKFERIK